MSRKSHKDTGPETFTALLVRESIALALLAAGVFFYLCIISYDPLDPSFSTFGAKDGIANWGGVLGSYLADASFLAFGGASYLLGLYFLINAVLVFLHKRARPKVIDFLIFSLCATFVAIFLHLRFGDWEIGGGAVKAGGTVGELLGNTGQRYLGHWGIYVIVVAGAILTFILASRLSLVETLNTSGVILGKGLGTLGGRLQIILSRLNKLLARWIQALQAGWIVRRERRAAALVANSTKSGREPIIARIRSMTPIALESENWEASTPVPLGSPVLHGTAAPLGTALPLGAVVSLGVTGPTSSQPSVDDILPTRSPLEPKILERKEYKANKSRDQLELQTVSANYRLPPLAFLDYEDSKAINVDVNSLKMNARILEKKLKDFAIDGVVTEIHPGPVITMYEFQPAPGVKLSRIVSLSDDLSLAMNGRSVRIVAPLPKKAAVGIEIPNHERETVWLKDVICDEKFEKSDSKIVMALGKDTEGAPYVADLQKMPHLLVAGATGSGKSVSINTMIASILFKARPDEVRMIMIDPKMIELSIYQDIPHLLLPVVTDPGKANLALKWAVREMERRYRLLSDLNVRNLEGYNRKIDKGEYENKEADPVSDIPPVFHNGKLPLVVIIIDEFADLMMVSSKEVEESVCRLAQKARAAGIHVILATQRPSVDVITGIIKANFPSRIAFKVTSKHDARTILDSNGAESLLGMGDMLFAPPGAAAILRMHGALISEKEILRIVNFLKEQAKPVYNQEILTEPASEDNNEGDLPAGEKDEFYDMAVRLVAETKRVSISSIQRQFRIGYNRAARIVEDMERDGVVSPPNHQGQRQVQVGMI